jgi:hypothetical protein
MEIQDQQALQALMALLVQPDQQVLLVQME